VTRLDRYILRQLFAALGFFLLVFTGVIWLTQALRLIDTVIASGQGASIFLLFSALVLPQVLVIVLPLSALGAALYAGNKLYSDSELVVMMSTGVSPLNLLRPITAFGAAIALVLALVMNVLVPMANSALAERSQAIRSDLAAALLVERQFIHPMSGLTLFIQETGTDGEMRGIFLNDQRDPERTVTYSAERALLVRDGMEARLVMIDGMALGAGRDGMRLNSVAFDQFVFDMSDLIRESGDRTRRPSEYPMAALLHPTPNMLESERYTVGDFVSEGHYRIAMPLLALIYPMIALVTLLAGGYRRSGFGRRVIVAVVVAAVSQVLMFGARAQVDGNPALWPLIYLPHLLALLYVAALLIWLGKERRPRRAGAVPA
jgi:lipopolysaccharide export system permease protein